MVLCKGQASVHVHSPHARGDVHAYLPAALGDPVLNSQGPGNGLKARDWGLLH